MGIWQIIFEYGDWLTTDKIHAINFAEKLLHNHLTSLTCITNNYS